MRRTLKVAQFTLADCELQLPPDKGLAHGHVRLLGSGWMARIPKQSQMGLASEANLACRRSFFERVAASRHTPALLKVLPPSVHLPRGAQAQTSADGEDWSADRSEAALVGHVRNRVNHCLSAPVVGRVGQELDALARVWPS
ncbi:MAG: hypothetical protein WEK74_06730 [Hydrogenophaga sp.]